MIRLMSALSFRKKKIPPPTRRIKDTPTLHNSTLFLGPGRTILAIPWPLCYSPEVIPARGFSWICGPIQPLLSMMM